MDYNVGWSDLADKIIRSLGEPVNPALRKFVTPGKSFMDAANIQKWRVMSSQSHSELENLQEYLQCCLVGTFNDPFSLSPNPTVIHQWFLKRWKMTAGLRVLQLTHNQMMFEFPSRQEAERIIMGEWFWNGRRLSLEWWSPESGTDNSKEELVANQRWIRAFGIPLHAWSEKSLKFIGDCCGGYIGADEDTKKRNHILWVRICIPAVAREPPHKIDLRVGGKIYEISIIADAFSKISVAGDSDEQGFNQRSKQVCVSITEQSINSNLKSADAPRVGPKKSKTTLGQLKAKAQLQQKTPDQVYVFQNEQPIDSNLKSAEDPRVGPKNSKTTLGQLKAKAQLQQKTSDHLYYSRRKKGNLHLNKKEILKEWKAIRPAQAQSIVAETQKLSERQSNAKLSQKPLLASLKQTDSLDEWEGDADDEAECMRPLSLLSLPPIHSVFSIGYSQDSGFSSPISSNTLSLPWSGDSLEEQVISHPTVIETSHWTKMVMTKACKAFGVNSVGFEHEIFDMILRMEQKRKLQLQKSKGKEQQKKRSKEKVETVAKKLQCTINYENGEGSSRGSTIKLLIQKWKPDILCLQETKTECCSVAIARHIWGSRWVEWVELKASGTRGGIIILWDNRQWKCLDSYQGQHTLSAMWEGLQVDFRFCFSEVYGPHSTPERFDLWDELAAIRGIWDGCWVIGGDFNVCRYEHERYNCIRRSQDMKDFSEFIQDMGLIDLPLHGATYTWTRGEDFLQASRIDRFLISAEWNEFFGVVKQVALPRVLSDHSPLALESGDWTSDPSYFKFKNMWLQHEGFHDMVKKWWQGYIVNGSPDFILSQKLKFLKKDLVTWNKEVFGKLNSRISKAMDDLLLTEQATEGRVRSQVEKNKILQLQLEIQQLAKAEETSWRQKSRCLWFF
ncbi:hypothetical protein MTR67_025289 [Solanum verrucosum]|uniref:DUF4283 domain-containing protein n=1 Tax=Solanum verrucosum TaxID=315347 RepID=A0AAF0QWY3_SOLVR|nr:hypothetical protein MTR67_025289 [Solanum verrucosum]